MNKPKYTNSETRRYANYIGSRIREIRKLKGISMAELGESVGLSADRIQKYESGTRRPGEDMLHNIALALSVNDKAIDLPLLNDQLGIIYTLFLIEDLYGITFHDQEDGPAISFDDNNLKNFVRKWKRQKESHNASGEDAAKGWTAYDDWRYNYGETLNEKPSREALIMRIKSLQKELEETTKQLTDSLSDSCSTDQHAL